MEASMKTYNNNPLLWSIAAIIIGVVFIVWPGNILTWLVWIIGVVSVVSGLTQIIRYFINRSRIESRWKGFPFISLLAVIFGIVLLSQPDVWIRLSMIVLSIPMILLAVDQIISLINTKKIGSQVSWTYYIFPILLLVAGVVVLLSPFTSAVWLVIFVGVWMIAYGVVEMVNFFMLKSK